MVAVDNVSFAYETVPVIQGASFATDQPFAVMGPSGCGKSTLFRLIAGLERPNVGSITVDGELVVGPLPQIRFSFQNYDAFPWASAKRNVELATARGTVGADYAGVRKILERTGLADSGHLFPRQLSGGMRKRLALARVIAGNPAIALLDEPFSSLDFYARNQLQDLLHELVAERRILLALITHDVEEAVFLCKQITVVSHRPLRAIRCESIDLEYPRSKNIRQSPEFRAECERVRSALMANRDDNQIFDA